MSYYSYYLLVNVLEEVIGVTEQFEPELVRVQVSVEGVSRGQEVRIIAHHGLLQSLSLIQR